MFFNFIMAIGAIGSFLGSVIALVKVVKLASNVKFKTEKLYGKEAEDRYDAVLRTQPERSPNAFGPDEYKGGNKATPQFEVERFYYDPFTMPAEWKKRTRTVRYYYEEGNKTMVRGWRL